MAGLVAAAPYIQGAGVAIAVGSSIGQGNVDKQLAGIRARQLREQSLADQAQAQLVAGQERKKAAYMSSRAQALAAASGTGTDSPDIVETISDIDEQGAYNALAALYSGQTSARSKRLAANFAITEGSAKRTGRFAKTAGTILTSGQSFASRYG